MKRKPFKTYLVTDHYVKRVQPKPTRICKTRLQRAFNGFARPGTRRPSKNVGPHVLAHFN